MTTLGDTARLVARRYLVGEQIGRGGMGEVYRATDQVLGREVAIKILLPIRETLAAVERFEREARAAAMLSDPHVVAAYDFGPHRRGYFLAMELVEGCTVSEELGRNGPLQADHAVDIVRQAAAGIAAAHRAGIVHRDIKPANLLLTTDGQVKVADFGIVRFLDDATTTLTATGQIVGTSHYLAPERVLGRPAGRPSDVYALGCVLYQLVTGHPPFMAQDPASIMYQHVETDPVPPSGLRPELAGEFEALLFWMLAKNPARRPTAAQIAQGATPPPYTVDEPITQHVPPEPTAVLTRRRQSRKVLAGASAALTLALAATAGILLDKNSAEFPTTTDLMPEPSATPSPQPVPTTTRTTTPGPETGTTLPRTLTTTCTIAASQQTQASTPIKTTGNRATVKPGKPQKPHPKPTKSKNSKS